MPDTKRLINFQRKRVTEGGQEVFPAAPITIGVAPKRKLPQITEAPLYEPSPVTYGTKPTEPFGGQVIWEHYRTGEKITQEEFQSKFPKGYEAGLDEWRRTKESVGAEFQGRATTELPSLGWLDKIDEIKSNPKKLIPFVSSGSEIFTIGKLLKTAKDLEDKKEVSTEDLQALYDYVNRSQQDTNWGYKVMDVISQLLPFAGEFAATGGIFSIGKKAGIKASEATLKKLATKTGLKVLEGKLAEYGIKTAGVVAGGTLRSAAIGAVRVPASTLEKQLQVTLTGDEEAVWQSALKAFGENWIEVVSERTGGAIAPLTNKAKGQLLKLGLFRAFQKANPGKNPATLKAIVERMGYNGVIGEMFEERVADVAHGILNSLGLGDQKFSIPSLEQLSVELAAFSVPGVGMQAIQSAQNLPMGEIIRDETGAIRLPGGEEEVTPVEGGVGARIRTTAAEDIRAVHGIIKPQLASKEIDDSLVDTILRDVYGIAPDISAVGGALTFNRILTGGLTEFSLRKNLIEKTARKIAANKLGVPTHRLDEVLSKQVLRESLILAEQFHQRLLTSLPTRKQVTAFIKSTRLPTPTPAVTPEATIPKAEAGITPEVSYFVRTGRGESYFKRSNKWYHQVFDTRGGTLTEYEEVVELPSRIKYLERKKIPFIEAGIEQPTFRPAPRVVPPEVTIPQATAVKPTAPAVETTAIAPEPQIEATVPEKGMVVPEDVTTPPEIPTETVETIEEFPVRPELLDIDTADFVVEQIKKPDVFRSISNLPGLRTILSELNPSAIANEPTAQFIVGRARLKAQGEQRTQLIMAHLYRMGDAERVFGKLDDKFVIKSGKFKGKTLNELAENYSKYKKDLTIEQDEWLTRAADIQKSVLDFARANDIEITEIGLASGQRYASRRVVGRLNANGEVEEIGFISPGPARIGSKISIEKHRVFANIEEARDEGFVYLRYDMALESTVKAIYNKIVDKRMAEWLLSKVEWRTTAAPESLVLAAEAGKIRTKASSKLVVALNRAVRGERLPDNTINSIASVYPKEAQQLKDLIPRIQAEEETATEVQTLTKKAKLLNETDRKDLKEAINARARAREKAMTTTTTEGMVMHPAFQGKVFTGAEGKKIAQELNRMLQSNIGKLETALRATNKFNALVRYFKLAGDASLMSIQLAYIAFNHPKVYGTAGRAFIKTLFDAKVHAKYLADNREILKDMPELLTTLSGTEFTELMSKGGLFRMGPLKIAGKVLLPFQRGFELGLDYAGIELAKGMKHLATTQEEIRELEQYLNEIRGLTSSAKLGVSHTWREIETASLLAPRYNRAIAALMFDAFKGTVYFGHSPLRARLARNGMIKMLGGATIMALLISWAFGEDENETLEHIDPRSSKFLTWNVGGVNIGPGTKFRSVIKLIAESYENPESLLRLGMDNPLLRFVRGNLSPSMGTSIDILTGKTYVGDPTTDNFKNFAREELISQLLPIWVENFAMEGGTIGQRMLRGGSEFFGGRAYPETPTDVLNRLRDRYAAMDYRLKWEDLNNAQKNSVRRNHPDFAKADDIAKKEWAERGNKFEKFYYNEAIRITDARNEALEKAAQAVLDGTISKYEYDKERGYIRPFYSGGKEVLWSAKETLSPYEVEQLEKWLDENQKPEDKALGEYWDYYSELLEKSDLPVDWDAMQEQMEEFLRQYPLNIRNYILELKDNWIQDLPEAARQIELMRSKGIEDETWWDNYRGETTSQQKIPTSPRLSTFTRSGT